MKKTIFALFAAAAIMVGCNKTPKVQTYNVTANFKVGTEALTTSGLAVSLTGDNTTLTAQTDGNGTAKFENIAEGNYVISMSASIIVEGYSVVYNGSKNIAVAGADVTVDVELTESMTSQLIIKELYCGGCQKDDASGSYADDKYITIYNNSAGDADASELVIGLIGPSTAGGTNKYYNAETKKLAYEDEDWLPAYSAIWWLKGNDKVTIPPYSEITIAIYGAIDHTATFKNSVNLNKAEYYWMSNDGVEKFTAKKYQKSEIIPASHYFTTIPISMGNSWVMANMNPGVFIAQMSKTEVTALSSNTEAFDKTLGTSITCAKFPRENVLDAIEVFDQSSVEKSIARFTKDINSGYIALTTYQGHTLYRNVDKAATEAIAENAGKLVTGYKADPSGIDAEASIKAGAKIVYMDTNNSGNDFHEREKAAIK